MLLHGAALSFLGCQKAVGSQSESEETRACDDALQRAIVGPSRRSPAGLRCPVCNLAMLLFFCSARRASYTHKVKGGGITILGVFCVLSECSAPACQID